MQDSGEGLTAAAMTPDARTRPACLFPQSLLAGLAMLALCAAKPAAAEPAFYAGKTVTLIVGAGVGGAYDQLGRLMARHIGKHIPGNPAIVVQNMPAAGSIAATNYIFSTAPKDGTVIALIQRGMLLAKLIHPSGVRFDIAKLGWIGSLSSETAVTLVWHTAPHKAAKDLFDRELIVGANAGADPETTARLYNSLIGTKFKIITGYDGTTQITLAIERGEVQGRADWAWGSLKSVKSDWLRDKKVTLLLQGALRNEPELGDVPNALDFVKTAEDRKVMELHFTQKTAARPVIAPPDMPAGRLATLREAFMALARDPDFRAEGEKARMEIAPISGDEMDRVVALIAATPAAIAERYKLAFGAAQPQ